VGRLALMPQLFWSTFGIPALSPLRAQVDVYHVDAMRIHSMPLFDWCWLVCRQNNGLCDGASRSQHAEGHAAGAEAAKSAAGK
jgi:hypothetical protein